MKQAPLQARQSPWHLCVVIPARNEEELLPRCLASVLAARARLPFPVTCDVVVAVDGSEDRTHRIAEDMLGTSGAVMELDAGSVGAARQMGCDLAIRRYAGAADRCWLANTDADCVVPENWLTEQLMLADKGIEAVAGIIDVDDFSDHDWHVAGRFRATYILRPDGSHAHVHGANLGLRADVYQRAGGWNHLLTGEDHDLWHRVRAAGSKTRSITSLSVLTSGRRIGRAPDGFAQALAAHNEAVS